MLRAARLLFAEKGYRATTTKEISSVAGVAEPTIFRHFGAKAELFEATIIEPFTEFVAQWIRTWDDFPPDGSVEDLAQNLVSGLFHLVRRDRRLFSELIAARADPANDLHSSSVAISVQLRGGLRAVHDVGLDIAGSRGLRGLDAPATIGAIAAMVLGSVLLDDWIYPAGVDNPGQERIVREMTSMIYNGIAHRPEADGPAAEGPPGERSADHVDGPG
jgi:AcrR family transcriptional regulator